MSGEQTVGSILGYLRLDADQFHRELAKASAGVERLDGKDAKVKVSVETARAEAGLAKVAASADKVDRSNAKIDKSSRQASRGLGLMATSVITLGPALVPLAAGAVGLGAAFGGMGAAGVLAIVGIRNEMKAGTETGRAFTEGVATLKGNLTTLGGVAARNVLAPFQGAVSDLQGRMPKLSSMVGEFSTVTGKTGAAITSGLVSAFVALEPLMLTASTYILTLSQRFQTAMAGGGITAFGDYVRSVFPQVMATLESLVTTVGNLVQAFAPLGMGTLSTIKLLSDIINAIDPSMLTTLATAAGAVFIGFRSWQGLSGLVTGLGKAMEGAGVSAERAATGMRALNIASGVIGIALAGLSFAMTALSSNSSSAQAATDNLTDALIRSNGAIDNNVRLSALKNAQDSGALQNAALLGISTKQVVDAYTGEAGALGDLSSQRDAALAKQNALVDAGKADASTMTDVQVAYLNLKNQLAAAGIQWDASKVGVQQHNDALKQTTPTVTAASTAMQNLANQYGTSVPVMQQVADAQKKSADAAAAATIKMQLENDAAGILKQSLDALNGKSLSAAEAQNAFESSLVNMGDHVTATGKKVHFTTTSINNMSSASVALRGQLNGQIGNLQRVVEANGGVANSTGKAKAQMVRMRQQIIDNAVAHGVDRKAVTAYIDKLLKIPKSVPPTKLDVNKAVASQKVKEFIGVVNGVPRYREVFISVTSNVRAAVAGIQSAISGIGGAVVAGAKHADGGTVAGPGGPREDKVMTWLSPGEEIIKNGPAQKHRTLLKAINAGKFANGGTVGGAYAAGGTVAPLGQYFSAYLATLGQTVTQAILNGLKAAIGSARTGVTTANAARSTRAANRGDTLRQDRAAIASAAAAVRHAKNHAARLAAQKRLDAAEAKYEKDRRNGSLQALRDTNAVVAAKDKLAKATKAVGDAEARAKLQAASPVAQFQKANSIGIRNAGAFIANLQKLASRGYGGLAQQLAAMGGEDAERIAASAAGASSKTLNDLTAQVNTASTQTKKLDNINGITTILSSVKSKSLSVRELAAQSGMSVQEILDALALIKGDLKGNKNAGKLLGDLSNYQGGRLFAKGGQIPGFAGGTLIGPGTGTSDSILAAVAQTGKVLRVSAGEFISTDASRRRNRAALEAGNHGATLVAAGASGPVELGEASLQRLASILSRMPIQNTISAGAFDRAMGGRR